MEDFTFYFLGLLKNMICKERKDSKYYLYMLSIIFIVQKEIMLTKNYKINCMYINLTNILKAIFLNTILNEISRVYIASFLQKFAYGPNLVIND